MKYEDINNGDLIEIDGLVGKAIAKNIHGFTFIIKGKYGVTSKFYLWKELQWGVCLEITKDFLQKFYNHHVKIFDTRGRVFIGYLEPPIGLGPTHTVRLFLTNSDVTYRFKLKNIEWIEMNKALLETSIGDGVKWDEFLRE